ncbi:insulinase family protein [Cellulomonas humilata]|uniref:Insulinase family protein n=1 Tax=Cellulomonas humilata TaxID=144055 RepID=A0A7Y5ZXY2_9CELL|nr:insulinase family protein [Cellulomonas humilata]NUU16141.1 insulinase family protein [Cellulomonas humilata]
MIADDAVDLAELADLAGFIDWTRLDGVPTLFAPQPGPITAGLFFRVGTADETLATAGLTHVVEHLALFDQNLTEVHHNGVTTDTYTLFHVTGARHEVVSFLDGVCSALRNLPVHRLETEKGILRAEASRRGGSPLAPMRLWRFGAGGLGLQGYDEIGLGRLTPEDARAWARTRFTRENAVLFVTDETVPAELGLDLLPGSRMPVPVMPSALPQRPAYFVGRDGHIGLDSIVRRSPAAVLLARIAGRALFRDLRQEGGYSYTATSDYTPWNAELATLTLYADALPDLQDAAVGAFVDTVAGLRRGPLEKELETARAALIAEYDLPDKAARMLPAYALDLLWGSTIYGPEQGLARLEEVTEADLREVSHELWSDALVQVPMGGLEWAGLTPAPTWSTSAVAGRRFPRAEPDVALVVGDDGISLTTVRGAVTVLFGECVAMTTRPDGARFLTGADGFTVAVEPTLHPGLTADVVGQLIDARVPAHLTIHLPPRAPESIPQPTPVAASPRRFGWRRREG